MTMSSKPTSGQVPEPSSGVNRCSMPMSCTPTTCAENGGLTLSLSEIPGNRRQG
jgi:hypothetical protein